MHDWFRLGGTERAPYALPKGAPALQDRPFYTRRSFVVSAVGAVGLVGSAGFLLGRTSAPAFPTEEELAANLAQMELAWARAVAHGPMEVLLRDYVDFVNALDSHEDDVELWVGMERLVQAALLEEGAETGTMLRRLMLTLRSQHAPSSVRAYAPALEERARSMDKE